MKNDENYLYKCTSCKIIKPNKEFSRKNDKRRIRKYSARCKKCDNIYSKKYQYNSEKRKRYILKKKYNISLESYEELYNLQKGKCAICEKAEKELSIKLSVDHCHTTGKVRGLLCGNCNRGIGMFNDNISLLYKTIDYLNS